MLWIAIGVICFGLYSYLNSTFNIIGIGSSNVFTREWKIDNGYGWRYIKCENEIQFTLFYQKRPRPTIRVMSWIRGNES